MSMAKKKSEIGKKVLVMAVVNILMVTAAFFLCLFLLEEKQAEVMGGGNKDTIVALNEISNLADDNVAQAKIQSLMEQLSNEESEESDFNRTNLWVFYGLSIFAIALAYLVIYVVMLRPFAKLERFAGEIAEGNLDSELKYERVHLFGQFTWAFDHMRQEIKRARQCEKEAVENNKTVIATLSHDIKTPIASIRAYSEALEANMDSSPERRQRYIDVIMRKCDEVTKITNDMFLHSLHDLDKLVMKKEAVEIHNVITETVQFMQGDKGDVILGSIEKCTLQDCDRDRIAQVLENLINNARKYAPGEIRVSGGLAQSVSGTGSAQASAAGMLTSTQADKEMQGMRITQSWISGAAIAGQSGDSRYIVTIKDTGKGIPDEDMPFIFDKFYRGKNTGDQPGAGLGLFIVKYIMEQMGGSVSIENHSDGMEIKLTFS